MHSMPMSNICMRLHEKKKTEKGWQEALFAFLEKQMQKKTLVVEGREAEKLEKEKKRKKRRRRREKEKKRKKEKERRKKQKNCLGKK